MKQNSQDDGNDENDYASQSKSDDEYEVEYENLKPIGAVNYGRNRNFRCGKEFSDKRTEQIKFQEKNFRRKEISNSSDYIINGDFVNQTKLKCKNTNLKSEAKEIWWKTLNMNFPWITPP